MLATVLETEKFNTKVLVNPASDDLLLCFKTQAILLHLHSQRAKGTPQPLSQESKPIRTPEASGLNQVLKWASVKSVPVLTESTQDPCHTTLNMAHWLRRRVEPGW